MSEIKNLDEIKNIVFDVGGILIGFRWRDMFADHGTDEETALRIGRGLFDNPDWQKLDAGLITVKELIDNFSVSYPDLEEDARWFINNAVQMRVPRPKVWEEVERLKKKGYNIYILSNYGKELFELHTGDLPFREHVDGMVVSYMINITKPDKGIYEHLLNTHSLKAEECVFFDDRLENVEAARTCGMSAVHIKDEDEDLLLEWLAKF